MLRRLSWGDANAGRERTTGLEPATLTLAKNRVVLLTCMLLRLSSMMRLTV